MPLTSIRQRPCHSARWQSSHDIPDRLHRAPEKWTYFLTLRSMHSSIYVGLYAVTVSTAQRHPYDGYRTRTVES
jgi:hypothetical protein